MTHEEAKQLADNKTVIGKLRLISYEGVDKHFSKLFRVECINCGLKAVRSWYQINKYKNIRCDCEELARKEKINSYIGREYGEFKVITFDHNNPKTYDNYFVLQCKKCGYTEVVGDYTLAKPDAQNRKCVVCHADDPDILRKIPKFNTEQEREDFINKLYKDKEYYRFKILGYDHHDKSNNNYYVKALCKDCNTILVARLYDIKTNADIRCNCSKDKDISGRTIGKLKVLSINKIENGMKYYNCRCVDCGWEGVMRQNLIMQYKRSNECNCSASIKRLNINDIKIGTSEKHGTLITWGQPDFNNKTIECLCTKCNTYQILSLYLFTQKEAPLCPICLERGLIKVHGMSRSSFYGVYKAMIDRCTNINNSKYYLYGARGIKVCDRWLDSFLNFYQDMYLDYCISKTEISRIISIDRIDNNGNYEPNNCRWATQSMQVNNTRCNNVYHIYGGDYTVRQLIDNGYAECTSYDTITTRMKRGYRISEAILDPGRRYYAKNPISFYDENNNRIPDPYNNRHKY